MNYPFTRGDATPRAHLTEGLAPDHNRTRSAPSAASESRHADPVAQRLPYADPRSEVLSAPTSMTSPAADPSVPSQDLHRGQPGTAAIVPVRPLELGGCSVVKRADLGFLTWLCNCCN
jgi:hypothetical protein